MKKILLTLVFGFVALTVFAAEFTVSDIQVDGNSRIEASTILSAINIQPGDMVDTADVDAALLRIFALGYFNDVSAELNQEQGQNVLTYVVRELPLVRTIQFIGQKELKEEKLRPLLVQKTPSIYSRTKIRDSVRAIKAKYIEEGYHAAKISHDLQSDSDDDAIVTFSIEEGEKVYIDEIRFVGNHALDKGDLIDQMETRERWFLSWLTGRGTYLKEAMEIDVERIKAAYYDIGYLDVKVKPAEVSLVDDEYFDVLIEIDEGPQYYVGAVKVAGDLLKPQEQLLELVKLKESDVYSRTLLRESVEALTDLYANNGYAYANVTPLRGIDKETLYVDLNFDVDQGALVYIEQVNISGNTKTRDKVIRRQIPLVEGDKYDASKIKKANRSIRNLGYFKEVNVVGKPGSSDDLSVISVDVAEQPTGTFSIGAGYSSVDKMVFQGSLSQNNLFGHGLKLKLGGSIGGSSNTFSLSLTDPYFLDTDWTLGAELYKTEREYTDYDDDRIGGAIKAGHPVTELSKLYLTYRYEEKELEITEDEDDVSYYLTEAEGESSLSSLTAEWVRNSTDNHQDPRTGGVTSLSVEYAGLGGTDHFVKSLASHRHFFPAPWGTVFSINGKIGHIVSTNDDDVPITEKFFLGGINTLRGFESREVGPTAEDDADEYIGGEKMAYFNFEYIFPIAKDMGLKGVLFVDTGNAWTEDQSYFEDMRYSTGAGIRWLSPLGPLRFEYGYNLDPYEDEKQSVFEFTIGTAF